MPTIRRRKPSVVFFENRMNGVEWYRSRQPMSMLSKAGWKVTALPPLLKLKDAGAEAMAMLTQSDIIYAASPTPIYLTALQTVKDLDSTAIDMGGTDINPQKLIFDYDDNNFAIPPYNPSYLFYGINNAKIKDPVSGKDYWQFEEGKQYWYNNGEETIPVKFDTKRNMSNLDAIQKFLQMGDALTTTTQHLANELTRVKGASKLELSPFHIVPNAVDSDLFHPYTGPKDSSIIKIVWTVSSSHIIDFNKIKPFIGLLMRKYKNVHLHLIGDQFPTNRDIPLSRFHVHTWMNSVPQYAAELSGFQADVGITWVNDTEFNRNKSPLKAAEYMACGIPVCGAKTVYGEHLHPGEDCLLSATPEEFQDNLERLILDAELRRKLVEGGDNTYSTTYSTAAVLPKLERAFYSAITKEMQ